MEDNWSDIIKSAVLGNILHLVLSFIYTFNKSENSFLSSILLGLILMMWLIVGFRFAFRLGQKKETHLLILGLVSLLPIIIFLIACQGLEGLQALSDIQSYSIFYFIGTPVLFWSNPFRPIMSLFKDSSIYIQLDINVAVVFLVICLGGYLGFFIKTYMSKKRK